LYRFGFFGFKKELMRKIGMMDERFVGGGHEDDDFYIRLVESKLPMYVSEEANYTVYSSTWDYSMSKKHFIDKWGDYKLLGCVKRAIPEESINYDLGPSIPTTFLPFEKTFIAPGLKMRKFVYKIPLHI
jgi:hypothetical protein